MLAIQEEMTDFTRGAFIAVAGVVTFRGGEK